MKLKYTIAMAVSAMPVLVTAAFAAEADNAAYRQGYGLILEQKWDEARQYFEQFQVDYADSAWTDDASFWTCYAQEQSTSQETEQFGCYENFLSRFPDSSWTSDARSKVLVLGSRLASRGNPQYIQRLRFDDDRNFDFDFDFDGDDIADSVAEAMDRAQRELVRVRLNRENIPLPPLPELPDLVDVDEIRQAMRDVQVRVEQTRRLSQRTRSSADDELLTVLAALRDNARASEILIDRFDSTTDPELRARIVLLLEEFDDSQITGKLIEIVRTDADETVQSNAVIVLLDRNDPMAHDLLLEIATNPSYPVATRAAVLGRLDRWDEAEAIGTLSEVLSAETNPQLLAIAADTLSDIGSDAALQVLLDRYAGLADPESRYRILMEIADIESPQVLAFLSDIALTATDDESAAIAIAGIADHENSVAVAALEHIYLNTDNLQRRLAVIEGIGTSGTQQAVTVLAQFLRDETNVESLEAMVRALGQTDQEAAVPLVMQVYRANTDERVQRAAVRAMRRLGDQPGATEGLLEILEDRLNAQAAQ